MFGIKLCTCIIQKLKQHLLTFSLYVIAPLAVYFGL